MDTQSNNLVSLALPARWDACAPYLRSSAGATVKRTSGSVFVGADMENRFLRLTIRVERVEMGSVVARRKRDFVAIAATSDSNEPSIPCGGPEFDPHLIIVNATVRGGPKIDNPLPLSNPSNSRIC